MAGDLRTAIGESLDPIGPSLSDPGKLIADDIIPMSRSSEELQLFLDVYTKCAERKSVHWKPAKYTVVTPHPECLHKALTLSGQALAVRTQAKYLGIVVSMDGFRKSADRDLKNKAMTACTSNTYQQFIDPGIPNGTLRTLLIIQLHS